MGSATLDTLLSDDATVERSSAPSSNGGAPTASAEAEDSLLARLDRMGSRQRIREYRSGRFTRHERAVWASRYPEEAPTVNGEFEWIVLASADLDR